MRWLRWIVAKFELAFATVLLLGLLVAVIAQVVARYIFNAPFAGTDELARFTLVWLTFVCASLVAGSKEGHIAADLVQARLPRAALLLYEISRRLLVLVACALMFAATLEAIGYAGSRSSTSLGFSMSWWYYAPLLAFALMGLHQLLTPFERSPASPEEGTGAS